MSFGKNDITGAVSGFSNIFVWDAQGKLKVIGGGTPPPPAPVVWGSITGLVTNQTDLINYLGLNFYPLSSNPAGYITQAAADLLYYPLTSNPAGYITSAALTGYVPTTRTLTINGTSYDLSADRSWTIPAGGTVTSIGMTVPSAFSVTPSSITVSGTFAITGAGTISQYIDGTGALRTFPTIPTVTPSALTKTDDTNVTLTLGGTPATALLQSVSLTLGWTGTLATGRGGTGLSTIGTALQYLRVNAGGTGLEYATFPTIPIVTPSALTKTDDTNVTLTLGGSPSTALLQATSLTLGWTGQLATGRGGTGLSTIGTSLQYLRVNSGGTALEYATFPTIPAQYNPTAGTGISITGAYPNQTITNTAPDQIVSLSTTGTGLSVTGTYPSFTLENTAPGTTYTVDNGLTENPAGNFQLGGALTGYTQIDGASNTHAIDFLDLTTFGVTTSERISLSSIATGSVTSYFDLYPVSNYTKWGYDDGIGNITEMEMNGAKMFIRTPGYAAASNGDVLTLISNTSGQVEFQTPASGGGGIPFAIASGTDTYTATVAGVTGYTDGDAYLIRFTNGNTDAATLNINSLGAIPLHQTNQVPLIGGDIWSGGEMLCIYNAIDNSFECVGTAPNSLFAYVTNVQGATISKGQAVYAFGGTGNRMTVKLARANGDSTSAQTIGFVFSTSIANNQKGIVIIQGYFTGLSLFPTATWNDGDPVYLSPTTAGEVTKTKPYAPDHLVYLGIVATASNGAAGRMYVRVQNGYELDELHNVQAQSPALKDTLWYDSGVTPGQWKTASIATILGYTPVTSARTLTINGTGYDLSADRSWSVGTVTSVAGAGTAFGLTLTGTVTGSGNITLGGTLAVPIANITATGTPSATTYLRGDGTWATIATGGNSATIGTTIDGSGGTITVGVKGYVKIPYACTITGWTVIASTATAGQVITLDIWKSSAGIPTVADTIINTVAGGVKPFLSSGQQLRNSTSVTNWTTAVAANDYIGFNVDAATTVSWVILQIFVTKT